MLGSSLNDLEYLTKKEFEKKWESKLRHDLDIDGKILSSIKKRKYEYLNVKNIKLRRRGDGYIANFEDIELSKEDEKKIKNRRDVSTFLNEIIRDSAMVSGLLELESTSFIQKIEELKKQDYLTIVPDTQIVARQLLHKQILPLMKEEVNWIQVVIPSCIVWELENRADQKGKEKYFGYRGLQEIQILKNQYPTFIVEDRPEIHLTMPRQVEGTKERNIRYDHLICRQTKEFMKHTEHFKNVYFITGDQTLASIARVMDIETVYAPPTALSKSKLNSPFYSILRGGWVHIPTTHFLWSLVHIFTEIIIKSETKKISISSYYKDKTPEDWLNGKILIKNYSK